MTPFITSRLILRNISFLTTLFVFVLLEQSHAQDELPFLVKMENLSGFVQARMRKNLGEIPYHGSLLLSTGLTVRSKYLDGSYIRTGVISEISSISAQIGSESNRYLYLRPTFGYRDTISFMNCPIEIMAEVGDIGNVTIGSGLLIKEQPSLGWKASIAVSDYLRVTGLQCGQSQLAQDDDYRGYGLELFGVVRGSLLEYYMKHSRDHHISVTFGWHPKKIELGGLYVQGNIDYSNSWGHSESEIIPKDYTGAAAKVDLELAFDFDSSLTNPVIASYSRDKLTTASHASLQGSVSVFDRGYLGPFQDRLRNDIDKNTFSQANPFSEVLVYRYKSLTEIHSSFYNPILILQHALNGAIGATVVGSIRYQIIDRVAVSAEYTYIYIAAWSGDKLFEKYNRVPVYDEWWEGYSYHSKPVYTNSISLNYYLYSVQWQPSVESLVTLSVQNSYISSDPLDHPFKMTDPYFQVRYAIYY